MARAKDQMTSVPRLNSEWPKIFGLQIKDQKCDFLKIMQERSCSSQGEMHMKYIHKRVMSYEPEYQFVSFQLLNLSQLELGHIHTLPTPGADQSLQPEHVQCIYMTSCLFSISNYFILGCFWFTHPSNMLTQSVKVQIFLALALKPFSKSN